LTLGPQRFGREVTDSLVPPQTSQRCLATLDSKARLDTGKPQSQKKLGYCHLLEKYIDYYNMKRLKAKFKMSPIQYRTHFEQAA
jgi:Integrase core domain